MPLPSADLTARNLQALAERWAANTANERASFQSWMLDLLEALGAERPLPPTPGHQFELPVRVVDREGRESVNRFAAINCDRHLGANTLSLA